MYHVSRVYCTTVDVTNEPEKGELLDWYVFHCHTHTHTDIRRKRMRALHHDLVTNVYSRLYYRDKHSLRVTRQYQLGGLEKHLSPTPLFRRRLLPFHPDRTENYCPRECGKVKMMLVLEKNRLNRSLVSRGLYEFEHLSLMGGYKPKGKKNPSK
jgi:hypothetical protein